MIVAPATVAFGTRRVGTTRTINVPITNNGPGVLNIGTVSIVSGPFTVARGTCGATLAAGRTCKLLVTFAPLLRRAYNGQLRILSNATVSPKTVGLTGTGN